MKNCEKDITIMLPTRKRTGALKTCIMTLLDLADNVDRIEILIAFDNDDKDSLTWFHENIEPEMLETGVSYKVFGFERLGYIRLNEYINALAAASQGRWLFFWSDDAVMEQRGWDTIIANETDFNVLRIPTHNCHPYAIFPIVPRTWFELLGHVSAHQLTDSWVSQIGYMADIVKNLDIKLTHDRADLTGNNRDETYANRPYLEGNPQNPRDFNHVTWRQRRQQDTEKIYRYLKDQGRVLTWWENVKAGKQDPWAKMVSKEYDPNGQMTRLPPNV